GLGPDDALEVWLCHMPGSARDPLPGEVGRPRLPPARKYRPAVVPERKPVGRRLAKRARVGADEGGGNGPGSERQSGRPRAILRIYRAPRIVAEYLGTVAHLRRGPDDNTVRHTGSLQPCRGRVEPRIAQPVGHFAALVENDLPRRRGCGAAIDQLHGVLRGKTIEAS